MGSRSIAWGAVVSAALAAVACGSSDSGSGGSSSLTAGNLPGAVESAICDNLAGCCQQSGLGFDATTCKKVVGISFNPGHESVGRSFSASAASACVERAKQAALACGGVVDFSCNAYPGHAQPGDTCDSTFDCAKPSGGAAMCDFTTHKCLVPDHGKAGDACTGSCQATTDGPLCSFDESNPAALCYDADGVYCSADGTCQALLGAGAACASDEMCGGSMYCSATSGACTARIALGVACPEGRGCVDGASCDTASNTCAPNIGSPVDATVCGG